MIAIIVTVVIVIILVVVVITMLSSATKGNVSSVKGAQTAVSATSRSATPGASALAAGDVLYADNFDDASSGWETWDEEDSTGQYEEGKFAIEVRAVDTFYWTSVDQNFDDLVLDVDATKVDGVDDNHFGVIARFQDNQNFYLFSISSDGYYQIGYFENDEFTPLVDWSESEAINQGDATNHIQLKCQGDMLTWSVNGQELAEVQDGRFQTGDIGLYVGSSDEPPVKIAFDDLVIREIK